MSWKDPFITITFPSKVVLTIASILLFIIHTGVIIGDLYNFLVTQRVDRMSFHYTITLLFSQVVSFYWALIATIYSLQAEDNVLMCFALTSLAVVGSTTGGGHSVALPTTLCLEFQSKLQAPKALNFAVFIARFIMEYLTITYREESYENHF